MSTHLAIQQKLVTNITAHSLELIVWDLITLRNILLDLKLVVENGLPTDRLAKYFHKIASMAYRLVQSDYKFEPVKAILTDVFPVSCGKWWFLNVEQNDFKKAFTAQNLQMLSTAPKVAIPQFKGLQENYRYKIIILLSWSRG